MKKIFYIVFLIGNLSNMRLKKSKKIVKMNLIREIFIFIIYNSYILIHFVLENKNQ